MVMVRSVRAFLNLQAGVTRSAEAPPPSWLPRAEQTRELEEARRELESKEQELRELRARPAKNGAAANASQHSGSLGFAGIAADGSGAHMPVRDDQLTRMSASPGREAPG